MNNIIIYYSNNVLQIYYTTTMSRWFNIYFPEYKTVYGKPDAKSGILILKKAPLPEDILTLGIDGVNEIWRDEKVRAVGKARAKTSICKNGDPNVAGGL